VWAFMSWEREGIPSFGYYDIYYSVRADTGWGPVQNCGENINSFDFEWSVGISRDGQLLLVSSDRWPSSGRDLFYSERQTDGTWGPLVSFGAGPNTPNDDDHPSLSPSNDVLYTFVVGPGLGNIWSSHKISGVWQEATPLPAPVNSITNQERDPCIAADGRTLWFVREDDDIHGYRIYTSVDTTVSATGRPIDLHPNFFDILAYPNPFNSTLSISLEVPPHSDVSVALYDLLGREADLIHRGRLSSSTISYTAPASLASGVYFVRASSGTQSQMKKVVLLK
jgi:hypothetical protein